MLPGAHSCQLEAGRACALRASLPSPKAPSQLPAAGAEQRSLSPGGKQRGGRGRAQQEGCRALHREKKNDERKGGKKQPLSF